MKAKTQAVDNLCRYLVKPGKEQAFLELLERHWDTIHRAGLTTDDPARLVRGTDQAGNVAFIELFSWISPEAIGRAHQDARVMSLWEPMGALCVSMEFWHGTTIKGASLWR